MKRVHLIQTQRGIVAVFMAFAIFVLIAAGAMAIDVGHLVLNKGRLQNMVDAAALSGAATLDESGSTAMADSAARLTLSLNEQENGNGEVELNNANVMVEFSDILPFDPGTASANSRYIRVRVSQLPLMPFLMQIFNLPKQIAASAVAGPSSSMVRICSMAPLMVCVKGSDGLFGYQYGDIEVLKISSKQNSEIGAGNFQLIRLDGASGAADLRRALAGEYNACLNTNEPIPTEPGNTVGPVAQGLNTRFGQYSGAGLNADDYPGDLITTYPHPEITVDEFGTPVPPNGNWDNVYQYDDYQADYNACAEGSGGCPNNQISSCLANPDYCGSSHPYRRILPISIGYCDGETNGANTVPYAGLGCFFLLQPVKQTGTESYVVGQFIEECGGINGNPGPIPANDGPYKIQLYHDPDSGDS